MRASLLSVFLAASLTATLFAGCFDVGAVTVPGHTLGERFVSVSTLKGYRVEAEREDPEEEPSYSVVPTQESGRREIRIDDLGRQKDRFLRETDAVGVLTRVTFSGQGADGEEDEYTHSQRSVFERSSREILYVDEVETLGGPFSGRYFPDGGDPHVELDDPDFGEMAGRTLAAGEDVVFQTKGRIFSGNYQLTLTFTYVRQEKVDGATAFVYEPHFEAKRLDPPKKEVKSSPKPTPSRPADKPRYVDGYHYVWYSSKCPQPVKTEVTYTIQHRGKDYPGKQTTVAETCTLGKEPLAWGAGTRLEPVQRNPALKFQPFREGAASLNTGTRYDLWQAWKRLEDNPMLGGFDSALARNPAGPFMFGYIPETAQDRDTWHVRIGPATSGSFAARMQRMPAPLPTLYQEESGHLGEFYGGSLLLLPLADRAALEVSRPADMLAVMRPLLKEGAGDVAVAIGLGDVWDFSKLDLDGEDEEIPTRPLGAIVLGRVKMGTPSGVVPQSAAWRADSVVAADLVSGGILAIGAPHVLGGITRAPWTGSVPSPIAALAPAALEGPLFLPASFESGILPLLAQAEAFTQE